MARGDVLGVVIGVRRNQKGEIPVVALVLFRVQKPLADGDYEVRF